MFRDVTGAPGSGASIFADRSARGLTTWWRYPLALVLALVLWIALMVGVLLPLRLANLLSPDLAHDLASPQHPGAFFLGTGATFGGLLLAFVAAVRLVQKKRFGDVVGAWRWRLFAIGATAWLLVSLAAALVDYLIAPSGFSVSVSRDTLPLALAASVGLGVQTLTEEWVFRGWLTQGLFLALRRPLPTAVLSGLLFAALHIPNGWPQAASALVFGIVTALIAMRTGGIAFTLGLHLVNNLFGAVVVVSANDVFNGSAGLFTLRAPALRWIDVVVAMAGFGAVLLLARRLTRTDAALA